MKNFSDLEPGDRVERGNFYCMTGEVVAVFTKGGRRRVIIQRDHDGFYDAYHSEGHCGTFR